MGDDGVSMGMENYSEQGENIETQLRGKRERVSVVSELTHASKSIGSALPSRRPGKKMQQHGED